jgi:hypothetical protein
MVNIALLNRASWNDVKAKGADISVQRVHTIQGGATRDEHVWIAAVSPVLIRLSWNLVDLCIIYQLKNSKSFSPIGQAFRILCISLSDALFSLVLKKSSQIYSIFNVRLQKSYERLPITELLHKKVFALFEAL